jgi:hypothetical protein
MIGKFIRVPESDLEEYLVDSSLFEKRIDNQEDDDEFNTCDIDKSWDAISFLITGFGPSDLEKAETPIAWTIFGAQVLDENQDLGYGPANYLTADQVNELHNALINIPPTRLKMNFDAAKMNELGIYPNYWEDNEDEVDYLMQHFDSLKAFYAEAAINGEAVISYLS